MLRKLACPTLQLQRWLYSECAWQFAIPLAGRKGPMTAKNDARLNVRLPADLNAPSRSGPAQARPDSQRLCCFDARSHRTPSDSRATSYFLDAKRLGTFYCHYRRSIGEAEQVDGRGGQALQTAGPKTAGPLMLDWVVERLPPGYSSEARARESTKPGGGRRLAVAPCSVADW